MGKILNALKTAEGDIRDLVMQCLEDAPEAQAGREVETRSLNVRRTAAVPMIETIFEKPPVVRLPQRAEEIPEVLSILGLAGEADGTAARRISLRILDASPLLSPAREDRRAAEQYRIIRTKIFHQLPAPSITVIASPAWATARL